MYYVRALHKVEQLDVRVGGRREMGLRGRAVEGAGWGEGRCGHFFPRDFVFHFRKKEE